MKPLIAAQPFDCRWPMDVDKRHKPMCCGMSALREMGYCEKHATVAFQKAYMPKYIATPIPDFFCLTYKRLANFCAENVKITYEAHV